MAKFGWCITGHHDQCQLKTSFNRCSCECHGEIHPPEQFRDVSNGE